MTPAWLAGEKSRGDRPDAFWAAAGDGFDHGRGLYRLYARDAIGPTGEAITFRETAGRPSLWCHDGTFAAAAGPPLDFRPAGAFPDYNSDFSVSFWYYVGDADVSQIAGLVAQTTPVFSEFEGREVVPPVEESQPVTPPPPGVWGGWAFIYHSGLVRFAVARAAPTNQVEAVVNAPGGWVHVTGTAYRDEESPYVHLALYLNGRPADAVYSGEYLGFGPAGAELTAGAYFHQVGGVVQYSPLEGAVALVRAYARRLPAVEIAQIYEREACERRSASGSNHQPTSTIHGGPTLFVQGYANHFGVTTLFVNGLGASGSVPLYIRGTAFPNVNCDGGIDLFVGGGFSQAAGLDLFVGDTPHSTLAFFVEGGAIPGFASGVPLVICGSSGTGVFDSVDLTVQGSVGITAKGLHLVVSGPDSLPCLKAIPLSVGGSYPSLDGSATLYAFGSASGPCPGSWEHWDILWEDAKNANWDCTSGGEVGWYGSTTLFLAGSPVGPLNRGMNLYVRSAHGDGVSLFVQGPSATQAGGTNLIVAGAVGFSQAGPNLVVSGYAPYAGGVTLYSNGF